MDTEPEEDQAQRRIELSSKQDLAYLVANVRRAAAEYMAEAFPQIEGQASDEDELRNQIEVLVDEVIFWPISVQIIILFFFFFLLIKGAVH